MKLTAATPQVKSDNKEQINRIWLQKIGPGWWVLLFFVLTSFVFSWPLVTDLGGSLFDRSDASDTTWRLGSIAHQLLHDPLHLYSSNTLYPQTQNLQLDELIVGNGLLFAPIIWLTANPVLAYNLLILSSFALSGFAMWLLVRHLTGSNGAGIVAGLIYAYNPWHQGQFAHAGLLAQEWMVFALYFLIRFTEQPRPLARRSLLYLGLFILFFDLQILCAGYYAYFTAILCGFYLLYYFIRGSRFKVQGLRFKEKSEVGISKSEINSQLATRNSQLLPDNWQPTTDNPVPSNNQQLTTNNFFQQIGLLAIAGVLALGLLFPFVWPYVQAQSEYGFKRDIAETRYWSAAPVSLLRTNTRSWLYKPVQREILKAKSSTERIMYPGLITLGLALFGIFFGLRKRQGLRWTFGLLALTALILSFGPYFNVDEFGDRFQPTQSNIQLPYLWLYNVIPGFDSLRVPHRFGQLFMLALAVCAGFGLSKIQSSLVNRQFLLPALFALLIGLEFFGPGLPQVPLPTGEQAPAIYQWLSDKSSQSLVPADALMLELPMTGGTVPINTNPDYLIYSLFHQRMMLNGSANILPPGYERLYNELSDFPGQRSLASIEALGARFLIVHRSNPAITPPNRELLTKLAGPNGRLEVVKEFGDDVIYRLKAGNQFEPLKALIPPGSEVFIGDDKNGKSLYTAAVALLLGPDHRYFSTYRTIYKPQVESAQLGKVYGYAILYKNTSPISFGYQASNLIWENEVIQIYKKS